MDFQININCDNDAFRYTPEAEVARILRDVAQRVEQGETVMPLRDHNGNTVGMAGFSFPKD